MTPLEKLSRLPRSTVTIAGISFMLLVAVADQALGPEVTFTLFYFLPIAVISWGAGRAWGLFSAFLGTALRLWADMTWWTDVSPLVHTWNIAGRLVSFSGVSLLISYIHQKQLEALKRTEDKYSRIIESAIEAIIATDGNRKITFANTRASEWLGIPYAQLAGKDLLAFAGDEFSKLALQSIYSGTEPHLHSPIECSMRHDKGERLWALVKATREVSPGGTLSEIILLLTDITERKRQEEEIQSRYKHISALQHLSSLLSLSLNLDVRLRYALQSTFEATGFSCGGIYLISQETMALQMHHQSGISVEEAGILRAWLDHHARDTRPTSFEPLFLPGSKKETGKPLPNAGRFAALASVPLLAKGRTVGVLLLLSQTQRTLTEDEQSLVQTFGRQIGIAVENAQLYESTLARERQIRTLSMKLQRVQEEERKSFARELHDGLSQVLTTLKIMSQLALKHSTSDPAASTKHLSEVVTLAEEAQAEAKQIAFGLRPSVLDDFGLTAAIPLLVTSFERRTRIKVDIHLPEKDTRFDSLVETAVYRIVQELLANTAKHAEATNVSLQLLVRENVLALSFADNGKGLDMTYRSSPETLAFHSGLRNLRERVEFLGGTFRTESSPGHGTEVMVEIPLAVPAPEQQQPEFQY